MNTTVILGLIRGLLIALGSVLAYKGIEVDERDLELVAGALTTVITVAWGIWHHVQKDREIKSLKDQAASALTSNADHAQQT